MKYVLKVISEKPARERIDNQEVEQKVPDKKDKFRIPDFVQPCLIVCCLAYKSLLCLSMSFCFVQL